MNVHGAGTGQRAGSYPEQEHERLDGGVERGCMHKAEQGVNTVGNRGVRRGRVRVSTVDTGKKGGQQPRLDVPLGNTPFEHRKVRLRQQVGKLNAAEAGRHGSTNDSSSNMARQVGC